MIDSVSPPRFPFGWTCTALFCATVALTATPARLLVAQIAANHPFEYMRDWLTERIQLDPGFKETFEW